MKVYINVQISLFTKDDSINTNFSNFDNEELIFNILPFFIFPFNS